MPAQSSTRSSAVRCILRLVMPFGGHRPVPPLVNETDQYIDMKPVEGRKRVVIEEIKPQVDCGRHPARRVIGDRVEVSAAIFSDGHDHVLAQLLYKHEGS